MSDPVLVGFLLFAVATLYSMVGHGGASGYLAVLALAAFSDLEISSTSLVLNLFVAGTAFAFYAQSKFFKWRLTWPFLVSGIPLAFFGAMVKIPASAYSLILGATLVFAAYRLVATKREDPEPQDAPVWAALTIGGTIGIVSGMIGIGGGIFLSPLILLLGWGNPKESAATSSVFIFVNSLAGLGGKMASNRLGFPPELPVFVGVCLAGAVLGAFFGSKKLAPKWIRFALAAVLLTAAVKLLTPHN